MSAPIRSVLFVADDLSGRGPGADVRRLAARLAGSGTAVRVVCVAADEPFPEATVHECPGLRDPWRRAWGMRGLRFESGRAPQAMHVAGAELADAGLSLAERWGIPYLLSVDEFVPPGGRLRLSRKWCRGLLAANEELSIDLVRRMGVPSRMVHVVHPGVTVPRESGPRRPRCVEREINVVGAAGELGAGAGFANFLNAARRVLDTGVDAEFVVAGTGEEESELRRRAERLRIADRVTFAAEASPDDGVWSVLDVYCQPSLVPTVGRGLRFALARGVPAVASDIEGLRALVEPDVTGLRVPPGDTNALAKGIVDLIVNPVRAFAMGDAGRRWVTRHHDPAEETAALLDLYARAVA